VWRLVHLSSLVVWGNSAGGLEWRAAAILFICEVVMSSGGKLHSEISRLGGLRRMPAKLQASMQNLAKARAKQAAQRTGLNAPESATGSKPSAGTRHQSPEWMKVEGGQSPIPGQRYVNRNGFYVRAERAAPRELLYRYDGRDFRACGLSK
jgi:hypothetical protein